MIAHESLILVAVIHLCENNISICLKLTRSHFQSRQLRSVPETWSQTDFTQHYLLLGVQFVSYFNSTLINFSFSYLYVNEVDPDATLEWLIEELQDSENKGELVSGFEFQVSFTNFSRIVLAKGYFFHFVGSHHFSYSTGR